VRYSDLLVSRGTDIYIFIHLAVCLTTGPKPLPKPALHIVQSRASSFRWEYPLLSLRSSSSFLCLLPRLPFTFIPPFIFPSITCYRRQFLCKMWPIQLAFHLLILIQCRIYIYIYTHIYIYIHIYVCVCILMPADSTKQAGIKNLVHATPDLVTSHSSARRILTHMRKCTPDMYANIRGWVTVLKETFCWAFPLII
jgi:hypothetical protein